MSVQVNRDAADYIFRTLQGFLAVGGFFNRQPPKETLPAPINTMFAVFIVKLSFL